MRRKEGKNGEFIWILFFTIVGCWLSGSLKAQRLGIIKQSPPIVLPSSSSNTTALVRMALHEIGNKPEGSFLNNYYGIDPTDLNASVFGILLLRDDASTQPVEILCKRLSQVIGTTYTFEVSLANLKALVNQEEVFYIALSRKAEVQLQKTRQDARIEEVHAGYQLASPYTGRGIITGLIDIGIEYTNPAFKTDNGDTLRIIKAWAQGRNGTKPTRFNYGAEYTNRAEIEQAQHDSVFGNHGTVVLGTMAGGAYGTNGKYEGAAPGSRIIAVSANLNQEDALLDGMRYVWDEAKVLKKRAVFNLSWGSLVGPRDGTSLFDKAIDSLVKDGLIVVGAAGNWGDDSVHVSQVSGATPLTTSTMLKINSAVDYSLIDVWGSINSSFAVKIQAIDKATGIATKTTNYYSTRTQGEIDLNFVFGNDTTKIYIFNTAKDNLSGRPNSFIALLHDHVKTGHYLSLSMRSTHNGVHAWAAQNGYFSNKLSGSFVLDTLKAGDFQYTVSELGGTSKSIITVGGHSSQNKIRSILGYDIPFSVDSGNVLKYSGYGPLLDGRTKPEITAPGTNVCAANRFEDATTPTGSENYAIEEGSEFTENGNTWYWVQEEATSYASPLVAGTIALMLEANPHLTFNQIRDILINTAVKDTFTGPIGTGGDIHWGWGKLNAYKAVSSAIALIVTSNEDTELHKFWYNNPVYSSLTVFSTEVASDQGMELRICDLLGREVAKVQPTGTQGYFVGYELGHLPQGQYIGTVQIAGKLKTLKITKVD